MTLENLSKIIITFSGPDQPGITQALTELVSHHEVKLIDIEQARTHNVISLLFTLEAKHLEINLDYTHPLIIKLKEKALEFGLHTQTQKIDDQFACQTPNKQFAITLLSENITSFHISAIANVLANHHINIDRIRKLNQGHANCLELITCSENALELDGLKEKLLDTAWEFPELDIAVQKENLYRRTKKLVVMDMDSTLIQVEVIDELAKYYGVGEKVAEITASAMAGDLDFNQSLAQRVGLLKGLSTKGLEDVCQKIPLTNGAELLIKVLKKLGYKIALISGGFDYFTNYLHQKLGLDFSKSNQLEIKNDQLTGKVIEPIINAEAKAYHLEKLAENLGISLESVIAIGDGANDIPMLKKAGLGIAFNAKKKTREAASAAINQNNLASILYLLGITDLEIEELGNI